MAERHRLRDGAAGRRADEMGRPELEMPQERRHVVSVLGDRIAVGGVLPVPRCSGSTTKWSCAKRSIWVSQLRPVPPSPESRITGGRWRSPNTS